MKVLRFFPIVTVFSSLLVLGVGCSGDSTGPNDTSSFSGSITLEGASDNSGVTVEIFLAQSIDSVLDNYRSRYPGIGVDPLTTNLFGIVSAQSNASTTTNAAGEWSLEASPENTYHIVFSKDGYGWRIFPNVSTDGQAINQSLKPEIVLTSGSITDSRSFENEYIDLVGNVLVASGGNINFSGTNYLNFNGSNQFVVQGDIVFAPGSELRITNNSPNTSNFGRFSIENKVGLALRNIIAYNNTEIRITNCSGTISDCVLKNNSGAALRLRSFEGNVENSLMYDSQRGLIADQINSVAVRNSIFYKNDSDIEGISISNFITRNNVFRESQVNLDFITVNGLIKNNEFRESGLNISIADISNVRVLSNNFFNNIKNVENFQISHQGNDTEILAHYNNFLNTSQFVVDITLGIKDSLFASDNYWGTTDIPDIETLIQDGNDFPGSNIRFVDYSPFQLSQIDTVGLK